MPSQQIQKHTEYDAADDPCVDAFHDGYLRDVSRPSCPTLAMAWDEGRAQRVKGDRRQVTLPVRPEGYFHVRPEAA